MKRAPKSGAKVVVLENSDPIVAETEAIQSRIRQRAFEMSQMRPIDAQERYDWIAAESEIISVPSVELTEKDDVFHLKMAVAGVSPEDILVMVTPTQIMLKAEYSHQHDSDAGTIHLSDFKSATVFRSVSLPQAIDVNSVKVDLADGMVRVTAVKEGAKRARPKRAAAAGGKASPKRKAPRRS